MLDQTTDVRKKGLQNLVAALVIEEATTKIALGVLTTQGLVRLCLFQWSCGRSLQLLSKTACRLVGRFAALLSKQHANNKIALIEDTITLAPLLQLRSKSFLETLYSGLHLFVRELGELAKAGNLPPVKSA